MLDRNDQSFALLPQDCWEHIFAFFTVSELCNAANYSQHARFVSESPVLWQTLLAHRFGLMCSVHTVYRSARSQNNPPSPPARQYWKQLYRRRTRGFVKVSVRTLAGNVLTVNVSDSDTRSGFLARVRMAQRATEGHDWPPIFELIDTIGGAKGKRPAADHVLLGDAVDVEQMEQLERVEHWERRHTVTAEHADLASAIAVAEVTNLLRLGVASIAAVPAGMGYPYLRATATRTVTVGGVAAAAAEQSTMGHNPARVGGNDANSASQIGSDTNGLQRHMQMVLDGAVFEQVLVSSCTRAEVSASVPSPLLLSSTFASTSQPVTAPDFPASILPPCAVRLSCSCHLKWVCEHTSTPAKLTHALQHSAVHHLLRIAMGDTTNKEQTQSSARPGNSGDENVMNVPSAAELELDTRIDAAIALMLFLRRAQMLMSAVTGTGVWKLAQASQAESPQLHPLLCIVASRGPAPPLPLRLRAEAAFVWAQLTLAAAFAAPNAAEQRYPPEHDGRRRHRQRWRWWWLRELRGLQHCLTRWLMRLPWAIRRGVARATLRWGVPAMLPWLLLKGWPAVAAARLRTAQQRTSAIGTAVYDSSMYGAGISATRAAVAAIVVVLLHAADGWDETRLWWGLIAVAVRVSVPHIVLGVWYELALATIRNAWRREGVAQRMLAFGAAAVATATTAAVARRARTCAAAVGLIRGVPTRSRVPNRSHLEYFLPWLEHLRAQSRCVSHTVLSAIAWKLGECVWSLAACIFYRALPIVGWRQLKMQLKSMSWWHEWRECAKCGRDMGNCSCLWSWNWLTARRVYLSTSSYGVPLVAFWSLARLRLLLAT